MTTQELPFIRVVREGPVAVITIDRQDKLNALNRQVLNNLASTFDALAHDDAPVRAAVLTGAGEKAFVAGADIGEMSTLTVEQAREFASLGHRILASIEALPFPVIAAVNGFALGGGCELALACDFIFAADNAKFSQPEVNLGVIPGFGGTQRLARRVGLGRARELIYTGDMITADEAVRIGLANRVVPKAELLNVARETAAKIATKAPLAVSAGKRAMLRGYDQDLSSANALEIVEFAGLFGSTDQTEGMMAFVEKRKAQFTGA
ncbi:MAG: enoyl-CoA hydratase/isomerase family protein [Deltaproteobacteria bacterium]|nr:enoyl-CoA hydratase/isomerase family protein [Deltaproteobacteria bacterium]